MTAPAAPQTVAAADGGSIRAQGLRARAIELLADGNALPQPNLAVDALMALGRVWHPLGSVREYLAAARGVGDVERINDDVTAALEELRLAEGLLAQAQRPHHADGTPDEMWA